MSSSNVVIYGLFCLSIILFSNQVVSVDYGSALTKSLLYYEAQRSGKLPPNQRVQWRADSALNDGSDARRKTELSNALNSIKWGTDYFIKAHPEPDVLYGEVGDGGSDHACWQRPEDMTTPRTTFKLDDQHPGSDLAAETAAALAAASVAFRPTDSNYADLLLTHAKQLFDFARNHPGLYHNSIPAAGQFYSSSGHEDELLWAAAWLERATNNKTYLNYLGGAGNTGGARTEFSWDDKYVGAQVLASKLVLEGKTDGSGTWAQYKSQAEQFICACIQQGNNNFKKTPGGLLWFLPWNNLQYVATASLISAVYSQYLTAAKASLRCPGGVVKPSDLINLARSQADYVLGQNPKGLSYMVGFGSQYPTRPHHRAASIVSIKKDPTMVTCSGGFDLWFNKNAPNPNVLDGAIVGGPDENDGYSDSRSNYKQNEPATVTPAPFVGVFASLA
uniref:Endoglucanase n=1 Tax=Litchi chinensis TaxID=151069 RepID=A0A4P8P7S4_LITCN|nr:endo-(1,4)-beta-D-glucanase [Litchi chinensis]